MLHPSKIGDYIKLNQSESMRDFRRIPPVIREGMINYLDHRLQPGHFLSAVFANDLFKAIGYADDECLAALPSLISFIYMETPGTCHGNWGKVRAWISAEV